MVVNETAQQTLMPERRRLLAHAKTIDAVQDPGDFLCDLVGLLHAGVVKLSRIKRCPCLTLAEGFVLGTAPCFCAASAPTENNTRSSGKTRILNTDIFIFTHLPYA